MTHLISSSLQPSSIPTYQRAWKLYQQFVTNIVGSATSNFPIPQATLALFIAHLYQKGYAISTVNTYVSALGYSHRLAGVPDPSKVFFIAELLKGYGKVGKRFDARLPISIPILTKIFDLCPSIMDSAYVSTMFKAMCAMAFYAFLRIGEITVTTQSRAVLQFNQLTKMFHCNGTIESIQVHFTSFKHHYTGHPISVILSRQPVICPVDTLMSYLEFRGSFPGPIFRHPDGSPVTRSEFSEWLARAIKACGLDPERYKGHSFRIGAASHAAECGYSETQIRLLGRWKSDAFKKYIRLPSLQSAPPSKRS